MGKVDINDPTCTLPFPLSGLDFLNSFSLYFSDQLFKPAGTAVDADIWSTIEPCIAIVSACLPMMGPLFQAMTPSRLRNVKSPFKSISSLGSSIVRQKEKNRDISLVEGHGGRFDRIDDASAAASKRDFSVDVHPLDAV